MAVIAITRRRLLLGATGAVAVAGAGGLWLGIERLANRRFRQPVDRGDDFAPSVYLAIGEDGVVTIWLTKSEMGQGVMTALPMILADELDADWERVRVEQAVTDGRYDYGSTMTVASASVRSQWIELRRAGATAREMLRSAAAQTWGVSARQCLTRAGQVLHPQTERSLDYGALAALAAEQRAPLRPKLKTPDRFHLIGTSPRRPDVAAKVSGAASFGMDVRVPGMRFCVIARPPTVGGTPLEFDEARARAVRGVIAVLPVAAGIAVVATGTHAALKGRDALAVRWRPGPDGGYDSSDVSDALRAALDGPPTATARNDVDGAQEPGPGADVIEARYEVPYLAHAPMEPMNCTARVADGQCDVWVPTQAPEFARQHAAQVAGLPLERVRVHTTLLGGGFGRRTATDFVAEAVEVAAAVREPVQVIWSREDDLACGEYRGAASHHLSAQLDGRGLPLGWHHRVASTTRNEIVTNRFEDAEVMGAVDTPYALGPIRVDWTGVPSPLRVRIWRSVGYSHTVFAVESFIDELAAQAKRDPVAYRLQLLESTPRLRNCLTRVAERAGWTPGARGSRHLGVAVASCFGSHIAQIVELAPGNGDAVRVERVWCAVDCGIAVHPSGVRAQIEGGVLFGLSAALHEQIRITGGAVVERNFDRYRLLRMAEAPRIEVDIVPSEADPGGVGELAVPPIAAAVANALYSARGFRARRLPLCCGDAAAELA